MMSENQLLKISPPATARRSNKAMGIILLLFDIFQMHLVECSEIILKSHDDFSFRIADPHAVWR